MNALNSDFARLRGTLEGAFKSDTAAPGYVGAGSSTGHCAVVALVVNALFGGELISTHVEGHSHWLNRIMFEGKPTEVDLTGDQFGLPPIQIAVGGALYHDTRVREVREVTEETLLRARLLAERADLSDAVRFIDMVLANMAETDHSKW